MPGFNIPDHILIAKGHGPLNGLTEPDPGPHPRGPQGQTLVTQPTTPPRRNTTPIRPLKPLATVPEAPSAKSPIKAPRARPKPVPRPKARKPLNTWPRFIAAHTEDPRRMARYLELGHKNHVQLTREAEIDIEPSSALYLPANNHAARIDYTRIATAHVIPFTESLPGSTPVFWVTLIAERFTDPLDRAGDFDPFPLQQWARAILPGCSFVGMVEAALYSNVGLVLNGLQKVVSWHTHLLLWGVTAQRMTKLRDRINQRVSTMIPGIKAAHFRQLQPEEIDGQALYMLKAPVNEYRVYPMKETVADDDTGEITTPTTGRFRTKKYQLGPGDLVRMTNIMSGKTLDTLSFAAGQGRTVLKAINFEARTASRAAEVRKRGRAASRRRQSVAPKQGPRR